MKARVKAQPITRKPPKAEIEMTPEVLERSLRALRLLSAHGNLVARWMYEGMNGKPEERQQVALAQMFAQIDQVWNMLPAAARSNSGLAKVVVQLGPAPVPLAPLAAGQAEQVGQADQPAQSPTSSPQAGAESAEQVGQGDRLAQSPTSPHQHEQAREG